MVSDRRYKTSWIHLFPVSDSSPYTGVVNKMVLGLRSDLDVIYSRLGSRTRADFHTEPPLPHGSFLWWVRYTWGCQTGSGGRISNSVIFEFQAKKNLEPLGENIYSQILLILCYLVITSLRIRDEVISVSGWLAVLKGKWVDSRKPQNPHALL